MIRFLTAIIWISISMILSTALAAIEVSGTVENARWPLPNTNVYCQNNDNIWNSTDLVWSITDTDGNFTITNIPDDGCTLMFSFVWYQTQTRAVTTNTSDIWTIILEIDNNNELDEVIVVGSGGNNCPSSQYRVWINGESECENKILCNAGSSRAKQTEEYTTDDGETNTRVVGQYCKHDLTGEPIWPLYDGGATDPTDDGYGIRCDPTRLMYGECGMNTYDMLGIRQSNRSTTPDEFVQDIVLTATTFIGTVLTFALIVSALMIIFGWANENTASKWRKGIQYALIGYALVLCSYLIIRLVQYIAW